MPIYEYQCSQCGKRTEVIQKLSDPTTSVCAECGGEMRRLMSAPAIQFKGTGWYKTDYGSGRSGGGQSSSKSESSDAKPAPETKTETTKSGD